MKIISLNTWGGRAGREKLLDFFVAHKDTTDVFCLQEIWAAPYEHLEKLDAGGVPIAHDNIMVRGKSDITELLNTHQHFFHPHHLENYGLMTLMRRTFDVVGSGDVFVHRERGYIPTGDVGLHARNIQYVTIKHRDTLLTVCNFHGLWNGKGKGDSEDRLEQSERIVNFLKTLTGEVVLIGDFNLLPETKSIEILEQAGLRNLVKEYGVTSTRTSLYTKSEKFADYAFVSAGITVKNFSVIPDEVSDHSPLLLEIE